MSGACCGTHVKQAGEIGLIKILGMINYKGGVRISMLCGRKAMLDYERKQKTTTAFRPAFRETGPSDRKR